MPAVAPPVVASRGQRRFAGCCAECLVAHGLDLQTISTAAKGYDRVAVEVVCPN